MPRGVLARLAREGKPVQRRLRVGVDGSGMLEIEMDDLDEPKARGGGKLRTVAARATYTLSPLYLR